ncbi:protein TIFY 5A-like [Asparagus officinalis]|uniref:protein TIFY 5A-like n=1 Tax=Asparagus officinalis TaxID=4686 RepID=UPI00098E7AF3|nr:protein TIFY 5A-like [Asparagus officinalis]
MAKGFDPELEFKLKLGREPHVSPNDSDSMRLSRVTNWLSNMQEYQHPHPQQQQITIFYNGRVCVCDVTELQARAIISMARREMEERSTEQRELAPMEAIGPRLVNQGLSMKRSLQSFLEKRKTRIDSTSPYSY